MGGAWTIVELEDGCRTGGGGVTTTGPDATQPQAICQNFGREQVTKRSTHARPGMHMQLCPAIPEILRKYTDPKLWGGGGGGQSGGSHTRTGPGRPLCGVGIAVCRPQKYPDEVGGDIPSNVPVMYPVPAKMGGNGGKWGEMGGNGVLWGEVVAKNKNSGARVDWFGFPIFPHFPPFPPFFLRSFHQCTPPPRLSV